jgi:hypothetical protein
MLNASGAHTAGAHTAGAQTAGAQTAGAGETDALVLTQAADVLSSLLTCQADRADARVDAMRQFIHEIGKDEAYAKVPHTVRQETPLYFNQVAEASADFVKHGGAQYADPGLKDMTGPQLLQELQTLQVYNIHVFMHLNQQRGESDSMARYLESIGEFRRYLTWAKAKFNASPASQPVGGTPEQMAARVEFQLETAHAIAWKKAEAQGISQSEFNQKWQQTLTKYREGVARKVEGMKPLADALTQSDAPPPPPPPPSAPGPSEKFSPGGPTLPPTVASPYTSAMYQAESESTWNAWNDNYSDVSNRHSWHH